MLFKVLLPEGVLNLDVMSNGHAVCVHETLKERAKERIVFGCGTRVRPENPVEATVDQDPEVEESPEWNGLEDVELNDQDQCLEGVVDLQEVDCLESTREQKDQMNDDPSSDHA
jgi:hypothetical protein